MFPKIFNYYHLYSIPTPNLTTIIPKHPYLASTDESYQYHDNQCQEINGLFYCKESQLQSLIKQEDCIVSILNQKPEENCISTKVTIQNQIVQQINSMYYILIFPDEREIKTICNKLDLINLQGTYILELPLGCSFENDHTVYLNDRGIVNHQPLLLPKIKVKINQNETGPPVDLRLQDLPLDKLNQLKLDYTRNYPRISYVNGFKHYSIIYSCLSLLATAFFVALLMKYGKRCMETIRNRRKTPHGKPVEETEVPQVHPAIVLSSIHPNCST